MNLNVDENNNNTKEVNFSSKQAGDLENECQIFVMKLEREKINYRLCEERFQKHLNTYNALTGKESSNKKDDGTKTISNKEKFNKKLNEGKDTNNIKKAEKIERDRDLYGNESEKLDNDINVLMLENKNLRKRTEEIRKEKLGLCSLLENYRNKKESFKKKYDELKDSNDKAHKNLKSSDVEKMKKEGYEKRFEFEEDRNLLEDKFHEIFQENLKVSKEEKKERMRKRVLINSRKDDEKQKLLIEENLSDRTPILDILIEKWKVYNKYKKQMMEKYSRNTVSIKEAFENMRKYLGIDDYKELPVVLEKMEEQITSIEMFISKLTNELDILEEKKRLLDERILKLTLKNDTFNENKNQFKESKKNSIIKLKNHIRELKEDIERKRNFFNRLAPSTDEFLTYMNDTYISDYVSDRVVINKQTGFTESNVVEILANVENYGKCMNEFIVKNQKYDKTNDIFVNKDIEKLKNDMISKLDAFRKDNYLGTFKIETKTNASYDETIKRMADELVKVVNSQSFNKKEINNNDKRKK